ncbi:MAG: DegT/DnrJ/EryC1/StrS family aminotransferase [Sphingobacteriales bacterium]|nr:MAG: DegT/DnrJ/EryC1/StrS family aminotransferase [Sphingobacteriales bacterium]
MPGFELFGAEERREINEVLDSGILCRYGFEKARKNVWKSKDLEKELCLKFGTEFAQLTSSGTTALLTALMALGIGAGHEVIIPTFGHVACFEAVILAGAVPVPVDINDDLVLDSYHVQQAITPATKAILLVHALGQMADPGPLLQLCREARILVIEDISQAIGASFSGRKAGSIGDAAIVSFDYTNTITCGEGGAVLTNDPVTYKRCDEFTDHGHDHLAGSRSEDQHRYLGSNFRISELHAAVGLAQLRKLDELLFLQERNYRKLVEAVKPGAGTVEIISGEPSCSWLTFSLPSETAARLAEKQLIEAGIPCAYWYDSRWHYVRKWEHLKNGSWMNRLYDDHKKQILHYSNQAFHRSDSIMSRCLSFAISAGWTAEEAAARGAAIGEALRAAIV